MKHMDSFDIVIETPKGSAEKYAFVPALGFFKMKSILAKGLSFPYDFGFIMNTKGEDGDPLDAIVISEFKSFPGSLIECRIIGSVEIKEESKDGTVRNDRYLAVPILSKTFSKLRSLKDFPKGNIEELQQFFINYMQGNGKKIKSFKITDVDKALKRLKDGKKHTASI